MPHKSFPNGIPQNSDLVILAVGYCSTFFSLIGSKIDSNLIYPSLRASKYCDNNKLLLGFLRILSRGI